MMLSRRDLRPSPPWLVQLYWPIVCLLLIWTASLWLLMISGIEVARLLLAGNIIAGGISWLVLVILAERFKRFSGLYWWAHVILLLLSVTPLGLALLTKFSGLWAILVASAGGILGLGILLYFWRSIKTEEPFP